MLLDCGEGTQVQMRKFGWGFRRLDTICLSHMHADHVAGLPGLLHTVAHAGRREPLQILGPSGTIDVVRGLRVIAPYLPYDVVPRELDEGDSIVLANGVRVRVCAGIHRIPCLAYRLDVERRPAFDPDRAVELGVPVAEWSRLQRGEVIEVEGTHIRPDQVIGPPRKGISLGFVTDTRPTAPIAKLMTGVDLLISEATYADDDERALNRGHMTVGEACQLAASAGAGELWLTHFSAGIEEPEQLFGMAQAIFPRTTIGCVGLETTLAFTDRDTAS